jgi:hypothetical protein
MADRCDNEIMKHYRLWLAWNEWVRQKPTLLHPIQYIKWLRREQKYRKENNK